MCKLTPCVYCNQPPDEVKSGRKVVFRGITMDTVTYECRNKQCRGQKNRTPTYPLRAAQIWNARQRLYTAGSRAMLKPLDRVTMLKRAKKSELVGMILDLEQKVEEQQKEMDNWRQKIG